MSPGDTIGAKYRIVGLIGRGGMGEVLHVQDDERVRAFMNHDGGERTHIADGRDTHDPASRAGRAGRWRRREAAPGSRRAPKRR